MKIAPFLIIILIAFYACKKTSPATITPPQPEPDLFIGGALSLANGFAYGVIWKNGVATVVPDSSVAISLSFTVNNLYTLGSSGVYSRDGIQPAAQSPIGGRSIAAFGTDVYITCLDQANEMALYWKNGQLFYLTTKSGLINYADSYSITISGTDVYITGTISEYPDYQQKAVYWKNGIINYLQGGYAANYISVSGNDVYVTGNSGNGDVYWINGQIHAVGKYDMITGITVSGNDIYISGRDGRGAVPDHAFYIKNDQKVVLPGGYVVLGIGVNGSDVYCVGQDSSNNAVYWKNSEKHILGPKGIANCILVENK